MPEIQTPKAKIIMTDKQIQKSGNESVNVQANNIVFQSGLSYSDVKEIAIDVYEKNFYRLSGIAADTARERAELITEKFLTTLQDKNPDGFAIAQDPDFQYALFTVQKEYAKTGDKDIGELLVDLLVERTKEEKRSLRQIAMNEALVIVPKLTNEQLSALTIVFTLKNTIFKINNLEKLNNYIETRIAPFVQTITDDDTYYQHIVYTGCASISIGSISLERIFLTNYAGMFCKGFSAEELLSVNPDANVNAILTHCLHNGELIQIAGLNDSAINTLALNRNISADMLNKLLELQHKATMNDKEVRDYLEKSNPCMAALFKYWSSTPLENMTLTSVGIAIGHANMRRITGDSSDLSIWIKT